MPPAVADRAFLRESEPITANSTAAMAMRTFRANVHRNVVRVWRVGEDRAELHRTCRGDGRADEVSSVHAGTP